MFEYNGAVIAARSLTIADDDAIAGFWGAVGQTYPDATTLSVNRFGEFMLAAQITGEPPLPMVTPDSPQADIAAAFAAWRALPRALAQAWRRELNEVENPASKK